MYPVSTVTQGVFSDEGGRTAMVATLRSHSMFRVDWVFHSKVGEGVLVYTHLHR